MNKVKFIPHQVRKLDKILTILFALRQQEVRIRRCQNKILAFDQRTTRALSRHEDVEQRDILLVAYNKHVAIYRYILDYYASQLATMVDAVIWHSTGVHPNEIPTPSFNVISQPLKLSVCA